MKHVRILRREEQGGFHADRGSLKVGYNHAGPNFVDPIILGESGACGPGGHRFGDVRDPLLLCEVGCDLGQGHSIQGPVDIGPGPKMMTEPCGVKAGEHVILDNVIKFGQGLGCGPSKVVKNLEASKEMEF